MPIRDTNYADNPSFETAVTGWGRAGGSLTRQLVTNLATNAGPSSATGWDTTSSYVKSYGTALGRPAMIYTRATAAPSSWILYGRNVGTLGSSTAAPYDTSTLVPVTPGELVTFQVDIATDSVGAQAGVTLRWLDATGANTTTPATVDSVATTIKPGTWTTYSVSGVAPAGAAFLFTEAWVQLSSGNTAGGERGYLSQAQIKKGMSALALGAAFGRLVSDGTSNIPRVFQQGYTYEQVPVTAGRWAAVSMLLANQPGYTSQLRMRFFDASNGLLIDAAPSGYTNNTGGRVTFSYQAPANAAYASPAMVLYNGGSTVPSGAYLDFDAIALSSGATQAEALASVATYFDGSSPSTQFVTHSWSGPAHASTSTRVAYTPGIIAEAKTDAPCPRVELTLKDFLPVDSTVTVWRTVGSERRAVRGARSIRFVDSEVVVDYEAPLGVPVTYSVEVLSGPVLGTPVPSTTLTVAPPLDPGGRPYWWIQDPLVPSSAIQLAARPGNRSAPVLALGALSEFEREAEVQVIPVLGSRFPVALTGPRMVAKSIPFSAFTDLAEASTALRDLLNQSPILLVRPGTQVDTMPSAAYLVIPTVKELPHELDTDGTLTEWDLTGDLVAPPLATVLVPIWTYGQVEELYTTYQAAQDVLGTGTYLSALKKPTA